MADPNIGKKAGRDHGLERFVLLLGTYPAARARPEIGTDGVRLDPAVTLDHDRTERLRQGSARGQDRPAAGAHKYAAEDQAAGHPPSNSPHTNPHALRALIFHAAAPTADTTDDRRSGLAYAGFLQRFRGAANETQPELPIFNQNVASQQRSGCC